jgi:hypothetical protein
MSIRNGNRFPTSSFFCLAFLLALPIAGQEATPASGDNSPLSKLSIHGFLTQAYGKTSDQQYFGVTSDGTSDLRKAALQVRYDATPQDNFVVQLAHERWGLSPIGGLHQDVELDWAFYQHTFSDNTWVRAGKISIPFGANNEIRDVGVLLPFYRLPSVVYAEGFLTVETVSGAAIGRPFQLGGDWEIDTAAYLGEAGDKVGGPTDQVKLNRVRGGQLWLVTPFHGVRFGAGGWRGVSDAPFIPGFSPDRGEAMKARVFSVEGTFGRLRLLGEWETNVFEEVRAEGWYGQATYSITDKLKLTGQYQMDRVALHSFYQPEFRVVVPKYDDDWAASLTYAFRPDVVLRLEQHRYKGINVELPVAAGDPTPKFDMTILSLSTSF